MNIKTAIGWADYLTNQQQEVYCVLSCSQVGIYRIEKKCQVTDKKKVVYTS